MPAVGLDTKFIECYPHLFVNAIIHIIIEMTDRNLFDTFGGGADVAGKDDTGSSDNDSDYVQPMDTESSSFESSEASDDDAMEKESLLVSKDGTEWTLIPPSRARARTRNIIKGPVSRVVYTDHVIDKTNSYYV